MKLLNSFPIAFVCITFLLTAVDGFAFSPNSISLSAKPTAATKIQLKLSKSLDDLDASSMRTGKGKEVEDYIAEMNSMILKAQQDRLTRMDALRKELNAAFYLQTNEIRTSVDKVLLKSHDSTLNMLPAYVARTNRVGLSDRWGDSELERTNSKNPKAVITMPQKESISSPNHIVHESSIDQSESISTNSSPQKVRLNVKSKTAQHPSYNARFNRVGWSSRWGPEETMRASGSLNSVFAENNIETKTTQHPSYNARFNRVGWSSRWGPEETMRASGSLNSVFAENNIETKTTQHPSYNARFNRVGWSSRWGPEETIRASAKSNSAYLNENVQEIRESEQVELEELRKFTSTYIEQTGINRSELVARAEAAELKIQILQNQLEELRESYSSYMTKSLEQKLSAIDAVRREYRYIDKPVEKSIEPIAVSMHPAYVARLRKLEFNSRWGSEEIQRIKSG